MQCVRAAAGVLLAIFCGCSLTTSLDGLSTASAGSPDAGGLLDATLPDATVSQPAALSCDELHRATPTAPDGFQMIDPDGPSGPIAPFRAWCDMTHDGGGWMLVSTALLGDETNALATVVRDQDSHGGLVLRVYANSPGCSSTVPATRYRFFVQDRPRWSRIRLKQTFAGSADCWHIWGGSEAKIPLPPNLLPFDPAVDVIRDAVRMGGSNGDAFDGRPNRCDQEATNFWSAGGGTLRSASVVLRRNDPTLPSGIETGADCGDTALGTNSPLWWEYRDIYVK